MKNKKTTKKTEKEPFTAKDWLLFIPNYIIIWGMLGAAFEDLAMNIGTLISVGKVNTDDLLYLVIYVFLLWLFYSPFKRRLNKFKEAKSEQAFSVLWWTLFVLILVPILLITLSIVSVV